MATLCSTTATAAEPLAKGLDYLRRTRNRDGGWPYIPGQPTAPEPSCYGALALCASPDTLGWTDQIESRQQPGSADPQWTRSLALLTLRKLAAKENAQLRLVGSLLEKQGLPTPIDKRLNDIDTTLRGWSWVDGTFSWVEPTSYALIALKSSGMFVHTSVKEAEKLLLDRVCPDGGWNYGNRTVRGAALTSMTTPTALAVLALQRASGAHPVIARALDLLDREVQAKPSAMSLALTVLGFDAFERDAAHLRTLLASRQSSDGSWRAQPHLTGLAVLALRTEDHVNVFKI